MVADIIVNDATVDIVDGTLVAKTDSPVQATFRGPANTRVDIRSGELRIQGRTAQQTLKTVFVSPSRISHVERIGCGSLDSSQVNTAGLEVGVGTPAEPQAGGTAAVNDARGQATIRMDGASGTVSAREPFRTLSDLQCKDAVRTLTGALDTVIRLRGVRFQWRDAVASELSAPAQIGLIAQEVQGVLPEIVSEDGGLLSLAYTSVVPVLIEAVKEQQSIIEEQAQSLMAVQERLEHVEKAARHSHNTREHAL